MASKTLIHCESCGQERTVIDNGQRQFICDGCKEVPSLAQQQSNEPSVEEVQNKAEESVGEASCEP